MSATPWIVRTARVPRRCMGLIYATGCGATINVGDNFAQSKYRSGLDRAEICMRCAARSDMPASWVLREKTTGKVICETFDPKKVAALNTEKYEAVPIGEYLASLNTGK